MVYCQLGKAPAKVYLIASYKGLRPKTIQNYISTQGAVPVGSGANLPSLYSANHFANSVTAAGRVWLCVDVSVYSVISMQCKDKAERGRDYLRGAASCFHEVKASQRQHWLFFDSQVDVGIAHVDDVVLRPGAKLSPAHRAGIWRRWRGYGRSGW